MTDARPSTLLAVALRRGLTRPDRTGAPIHFRFVRPDDDVDAITRMLHDAYAPLAAAGMRFVASHQSADVTRRRMARGDTVVALDAGRIVGTVTLSRCDATDSAPFYDRPDVASFGQFAVAPAYQRRGIGSTLLDLVEGLAAERSVGQLALDTSEHATALIGFYEARGYRTVDHHRWPEVNYRSVILAKVPARLDPPAATT